MLKIFNNLEVYFQQVYSRNKLACTVLAIFMFAIIMFSLGALSTQEQYKDYVSEDDYMLGTATAQVNCQYLMLDSMKKRIVKDYELYRSLSN